MLEKDGVATSDLINGVIPDENRRAKEAYACIECFQNIPCNPCYSSCPQKAINDMQQITKLPKVDFEKCNGCGICANNCPGLAIFIIDETYSDTEAVVKIPYEFLPLPNKGDVVIGTTREGKRVCDATVINVLNGKAQDRTPSVWLKIPKQYAMDVRCFALKDEMAQRENSCACDCLPIENVNDDTADNTYICRCEEVTVKQLREYISKGYTTLNEIKIASRAGMGACQGRTCRQLIMGELAKATGQKQEDLPTSTFRPPVKPIKMSLLCNESDEQ